MLSKIDICEIVRTNAEVVFPDLVDIGLSGLCGICSGAISYAFASYGYNNYLVIGKYRKTQYFGMHCWTECGDLIYDITAQQFNGENLEDDFEEVNILPKTHHYFAPSSYVENPTIDDIRENFQENQQYLNWYYNDENFRLLLIGLDVDISSLLKDSSELRQSA